jgi:hypothetical protein
MIRDRHLAVGVASLLIAAGIFLWGDNIISRWNEPAGEPQPPPLPPSSDQVWSDLFRSVCASRSIAVSFEANPNDHWMYRRMSGTTIVPLNGCSDGGRFFTNYVRGFLWIKYYEEGRVLGDLMEFRFYGEDQGIVCRVQARKQENEAIMRGRISCENIWSDLTMRAALVELQ